MNAFNQENSPLFCFAFPEFSPFKLYAYGVKKIYHRDDINEIDWRELNSFFRENRWLLGWLKYDLINSDNSNHNLNPQDDLPAICWLEPEHLFIAGEKVEHIYSGSESFANELLKRLQLQHSGLVQLHLSESISLAQYQEAFNRTIYAIKRGDVYEANLCIRFGFRSFLESPFATWRDSLPIMNAPFSCYVHWGSSHIMSFSPERYLRKVKDKIFTQPIKGTIASSPDRKLDLENKTLLISSVKDLTENRMVVDLVRNDLCMICETDSVVVDELASIKSFPGLHHLVSTVSGTLIKDDISDIIKATFPMASMTGIPKKSMITLMNSIEKQPRGIYSGSIGYKKPNGDFDFNVVIRTFLYNSIQQSASISTGGAITSMSNAKDEYLECITKVSRLLKTIHPELDLSSLSSI